MATFLSPDHMTLAQALEYLRYDGSLSFFRKLEKRSWPRQMMPWFPTSDGAVHKGVRATALPEGKFGVINKAVPTGYGASTEYTESVGVYELASFVDTRILQGRSQEEADRIRAARDEYQLRGFLQGLAKNIITAPKSTDGVTGLLARRGKVDGEHTISMGATGADVGSILFVRFGDDGVSCRYPSASSPNVVLEDLGQQPGIDTNDDGTFAGTFPSLATLIRVFYAVDVADDDALVRVVNVPTKTALSAAQVGQLVDIINVNLDDMGAGYVAFAPKQIISQFQKYLLDKNNINFSRRQIEGMGAPTELLGVPFFYEEFMGVEGQIS